MEVLSSLLPGAEGGPVRVPVAPGDRDLGYLTLSPVASRRRGHGGGVRGPRPRGGLSGV